MSSRTSSYIQYLQTVQEDGENTEDSDRKTQAKTEQEDGENTEDRDRRRHACALKGAFINVCVTFSDVFVTYKTPYRAVVIFLG